MSERSHVTRVDIVHGLRALDLKGGECLLVHSSLSSFGYVEGGANTVIDALLAVVGPQGKVVVPTLTGSEALSAANPPVFDPQQTPCWTGRIPETFRQRPNAVRSVHPTHSVAAIGAQTHALVQEHIDSVTPCDARSPYGKMAHRADSYILLLGVDHESSTMFHAIEEAVGVDYHMQPGFVKVTLHLGEETLHRHYMLHKYGARRNFSVMEPVLIERGVQRETAIGDARVRLVKAREMFELGVQALTVDEDLFCAR